MDYGQRLAKVETEVDAIYEQLREINAEQIRHRECLEKLRDHTERGFAEARDRTEREFAEARDHTEQEFAEARDHTEREFITMRDNTRQEFSKYHDRMDRGFAEIRSSLDEIRKEQTKTTRWLVGLTITYGTAIIGMMAKMAGMI